MKERLKNIRESARIADLYGLLALLITLHVRGTLSDLDRP